MGFLVHYKRGSVGIVSCSESSCLFCNTLLPFQRQERNALLAKETLTGKEQERLLHLIDEIAYIEITNIEANNDL